jgi:hypothetical protein
MSDVRRVECVERVAERPLRNRGRGCWPANSSRRRHARARGRPTPGRHGTQKPCWSAGTAGHGSRGHIRGRRIARRVRGVGRASHSRRPSPNADAGARRRGDRTSRPRSGRFERPSIDDSTWRNKNRGCHGRRYRFDSTTPSSGRGSTMRTGRETLRARRRREITRRGRTPPRRRAGAVQLARAM